MNFLLLMNPLGESWLRASTIKRPFAQSRLVPLHNHDGPQSNGSQMASDIELRHPRCSNQTIFDD